MFHKARFIVKYWFTWIIFFEVSRLGFLLANLTNAKEAGIGTSLLSLWYGLKMDMSMAAYISLPVAIFVLFSIFIPFFQRSVPYIIYTTILIPVFLFLIYADIGLFKAWGFRLDATPLKYISSPKEVWASINHLPLMAIFLSWILLTILFIYAAKKLLIIGTPVLAIPSKKGNSLFFLVIITGLFIIPIRGGFQLAPLNQSSVYFSQNNFANMASLNAPWNFLHALGHRSNSSTNPFKIDTKEKIAIIRSQVFAIGTPNSTLQITDVNKPNILFIIWESLTAKAVGLEVNGKPVIPGFDQLVKEGVYFTDLYATGDRTDKGIVGVLSGYPSQPTQSIIKEPTKAAKLPMLSKTFKQKGYHTSFFYGGELEFANMKAYLLQGGFDHFITINDFEKSEQNSKWGAHDGVVMQRLQQNLNNPAQPFFSTWLTLSSHEPYEIPSKRLFESNAPESQFFSSLHYTDSVVFDFIKHAKTQPWWNNTLIVIVADHGHKLPVATSKAEDFKIPLLFLGGALSVKNTRVNKIGSQTDVAATLLTQLKIPADEFKWSRNLLDTSTVPWAFFSFNNGFGYITTRGKFIFDNVGKIPIEKGGSPTDEDILYGKAIQQAAFQDYLDK